MHWWQALIIGIVEGLTEYVPVSSTGHVLLAQRALGIPKGEASDAFAICVQGGAILAVLGLYWRHVRRMAAGVLGQDDAGRKLALCVLVALLPLGPIYPLEHFVKERLFSLDMIALAWFAGGVVILWFVARRRQLGVTPVSGMPLDALTWQRALLIGCAQCVAVWPGTSRSLVTILAGLAVGLRLAAAVEFSFLLGVVVLTGVTLVDAAKHGKAMVHSYGAASLAIGGLAAAVSAAIAVKWMVSYLNRRSIAVFGYYRIALAAVVIALIVAGALDGK